MTLLGRLQQAFGSSTLAELHEASVSADRLELINQIKGGCQKRGRSVRCDRNSERALNRLIKDLESFIDASVNRQVKGDANALDREDIAQQIKAELPRMILKYDPDRNTKLTTFIFPRIKARVIDFFRKRRDEKRDLEPEIIDLETAFTPRDPLKRLAAKEGIKAALSKLPPEQREVVILTFGIGQNTPDLTRKEIGQRLGISSGTVASRLRLAIKKLKRDPAVRELIGEAKKYALAILDRLLIEATTG